MKNVLKFFGKHQILKVHQGPKDWPNVENLTQRSRTDSRRGIDRSAVQRIIETATTVSSHLYELLSAETALSHYQARALNSKVKFFNVFLWNLAT